MLILSLILVSVYPLTAENYVIKKEEEKTITSTKMHKE